ncbi:MAG: hypothetical protein WDO13_04120 [Verrucomicrobiota bacterium]
MISSIRHFVVQAVQQALRDFSGAPAAKVIFSGGASDAGTTRWGPMGLM